MKNNKEGNVNKAIFEMLQMLDEKITKLINRFDRLAKELGYKV